MQKLKKNTQYLFFILCGQDKQELQDEADRMNQVVNSGIHKQDKANAYRK